MRKILDDEYYTIDEAVREIYNNLSKVNGLIDYSIRFCVESIDKEEKYVSRPMILSDLDNNVDNFYKKCILLNNCINEVDTFNSDKNLIFKVFIKINTNKATELEQTSIKFQSIKDFKQSIEEMDSIFL